MPANLKTGFYRSIEKKIDMFIMQNSKNFAPMKLQTIKEALTNLDDDKAPYVLGLELKDPSTVLIISILIGSWGIDRFMLGEAGLGVLKLLTCGGCSIWWIVDMISAQERTKEYNFNKVKEALVMQGISIF